MAHVSASNKPALPAESALRDLRPLWLVPTLLLSGIVGLFARDGYRPLGGQPFWVWWSAGVCLTLLLYWLIHRRAEALAAALRARAESLAESHSQIVASRDRLAAVAEENARLYAESRRRADALRLLAQRLAEAVTPAEDVARIAAAVAEQAVQLVGCDGAGVFLLSEDRRALVPTAFSLTDEDARIRRFYECPLTLNRAPFLQTVLSAPAPVGVADARTLGETGMWAETGMRGLLLAPLRGTGPGGGGAGTRGLLLLHWHGGPHEANEEEIGLTVALSGFCGAALENARQAQAARATQIALLEKNARLLDETRRRGDELHLLVRRVGDALAAGLSRARVSELVAAQARQMIPCRRAVFSLFDGAQEFEALAVAEDDDGRAGSSELERWRLSEFPFLRGVLERAHPLMIADVAADGRLGARERAALRARDVSALLLAPLRGRGERVLGLLSLVWTNAPYTPTAEEFNVIGALAAQGGAALENARLVEDLERAEAQTRARLAEATAARDFVQRILQNVQAAVLVVSADNDLTVQTANALAEVMPDADRQQDGLVGRRLADVFPGLEAVLEAPLQQAVRHGESSSLADARYDGFGRGTTFWTFSVTPQRDPLTRRVAQIVILALETTDRIRLLRENEQTARRERDRANELDATLRSLSDGVVRADRTGRLSSINQAGQAALDPDDLMLGAPIEAWVARIGLRYPNGSPVPTSLMPLARTLQTGEPSEREEFQVVTRRGEARTIELAATPVLDGDGASGGAVAVFRDITALKRSQAQEAAANARVETLVGISRRLNATLDLMEIEQIVVEGALLLLPGLPDARAALFVSEGEGRPLRRVAVAPEKFAPAGSGEPPAFAFRAASSLLWRLYVARQPVVSPELEDDALLAAPADCAFLPPGPARSALLLPLVARDLALGHLALSSSAPHAFDDPRLADALLNLTALAVTARINARLYGQMQQKADELHALWTVGQAIASKLELEEVVDTLTDRVRAVLNCDRCSVSLFEPEDGTLQVQGAGKAAARSAEAERVTEQAARTGQPAAQVGPPGQASALAMPLPYGNETLGALTVETSDGRPFTPEQLKLLDMLAALAVAVVRNARTFAHEHRIAETLQKSFLPHALTRMAGLDIAEKYYPTRLHEARIGGDYYDFLPLGPRRLAVVIGDISGKGLAAAVHTAMAKYSLRAFTAQDMPPVEVVARANVAIARYTADEVFSTLFYGIIDLEQRTLTYVNAGHEPPQLVRASGDALALEPTGPIMGAFAEAEFEQAQVSLTPGDTLALYTDGLSDARAPGGAFFGEDGIRTHLQSVRNGSAEQAAASLYGAALAFGEGQGMRDDIALLVVKVLGED